MITSFCHRFAAAMLIAAAAAVPASAASFDCAKARLDYEKAVCSDKNISSLDEKLAAAYQDLGAAANNPAALRTSQREWARGRGECMKDRGKALACLADTYIKRTRLLSQAANALRAPDNKRRFVLKDVSKMHDFEIRMLERCKKPDACDGPALVLVTRKGEAQPFSFVLHEQLMIMEPAHETVRVDDYNQDGTQDFALRIGSHDDYHQPIYDYYTSTPEGSFAYHAELTGLASDSKDGVDIDPETRELTTLAGNRTQEFSRYWYKLEGGKIINTRRLDVKDHLDGKHATFTYYNWKNGKWQRDRVEKHR